jgi:gpW
MSGIGTPVAPVSPVPLTDTQRLAEAREALHAVMTGQTMTVVGYDGRNVRYTSANVDQLRVYIAELEAKVDPRMRRSPFSVRW